MAKKLDWLWFILLLLFIGSWLPVIPEPYFHKYRVNFWEWLRRELDEEVHGEADTLRWWYR